ncbi:MAG: hypothetical protein ABIO44_14300, partial [Saprospiraceae bacterium]
MHSFDWSTKGKSYIISFTCNGKAYCEELEILPERCFDLTVIHILHEIQLSDESERRETWYCDLLGDALGFGIGLVSVDQERELLRQGL